ncbi:MAG: group II intron reverse transcriptase domain-containing protein [Candidatus Omnitrophica bacterium]|nr:group II intron reverse transcriptase domain-containing protein [Candidatus Omnitrophota bacterium]
MSSLVEEIASFSNLLRAWKTIRNRLTQEEYLFFFFNLEENLICLSDALRQASYSPAVMPVRYHLASSGERIPVPCLKDRLVALAARKALLSKLLPSFIYDTYAGIPSRGVHRAVKRVMEFQRRTASPQNPRSGWILKLDVKDFYPSLRHDVILRQLKVRINDTNLVKLISQFLSGWAGWQATPNKGIPLGSSLSPVLSNLYLDSLDHFVKDGLGFKFYARYADDMVFVSKDKNELEFILDKTKQFLKEELGVFLNPRKTLFKPTADGLDFLGYRIFYYHLLLRKKNMKKVKKRFFNLARRYAKGDLKLLDIKSSLAGWLGYAGFANTYNFRRKLFADFRLKRAFS